MKQEHIMEQTKKIVAAVADALEDGKKIFYTDGEGKKHTVRKVLSDELTIFTSEGKILQVGNIVGGAPTPNIINKLLKKNINLLGASI